MSNRESGPVPILLTEPQRRHLAVFLEQVDEGLAELSAAMIEPARQFGLLRVERADVPPSFADAARGAVAEARARIERLATRLDLRHSVDSRRQRFQALLLSMIVNLEDAGSRGLKGYGTVDPSVAEQVDPAIEEIRAVLLRIHDRLEDAVADARREGAS